jgi:hypothetical protein
MATQDEVEFTNAMKRLPEMVQKTGDLTAVNEYLKYKLSDELNCNALMQVIAICEHIKSCALTYLWGLARRFENLDTTLKILNEIAYPGLLEALDKIKNDFDEARKAETH